MQELFKSKISDLVGRNIFPMMKRNFVDVKLEFKARISLVKLSKETQKHVKTCTWLKENKETVKKKIQQHMTPRI